jgi:hypothetical protein
MLIIRRGWPLYQFSLSHLISRDSQIPSNNKSRKQSMEKHHTTTLKLNVEGNNADTKGDRETWNREADDAYSISSLCASSSRSSRCRQCRSCGCIRSNSRHRRRTSTGRYSSKLELSSKQINVQSHLPILQNSGKQNTPLWGQWESHAVRMIRRPLSKKQSSISAQWWSLSYLKVHIPSDPACRVPSSEGNMLAMQLAQLTPSSRTLDVHKQAVFNVPHLWMKGKRKAKTLNVSIHFG